MKDAQKHGIVNEQKEKEDVTEEEEESMESWSARGNLS